MLKPGTRRLLQAAKENRGLAKHSPSGIGRTALAKIMRRQRRMYGHKYARTQHMNY